VFWLNNPAGFNRILEKGRVISRWIVAPGYCRLALKAPEIAQKALPGQFVQVFMPSGSGPMLPRPFSVFHADRSRGELVLLFEVKGPGTTLLAGAEEGEAWQLLGPLGNGFPSLPSGAMLVAGGMGIAPLAFLAASTEMPRTLIYGAPTATLLTCPSGDLDLPGLNVLEVTEDGSRGEKGTAVDLLAGVIKDQAVIFACGPSGMLSAVQDLCSRHNLPGWVSVEERMACGIGACVGCVTATKNGYKRVCKDGPVFPVEEVVLR